MYKASDFPIRKYEWDTNKNKKHVENTFTLDTETSSLFLNTDTGEYTGYDSSKGDRYYDNCVKIGLCYIWMMSVDGDVYYDRDLSRLPDFLAKLSKSLRGKQFFVYVHNLGYDFEFLSNVLNFTQVFARKAHKPFKAFDSDHNCVFKDSYVLSMSSLECLPKQYNLPVEKLSGDLDYLKLRGPNTPLSSLEMSYCENDCLVLHHYIEYKKKEAGSISKIAMTQTGEVRRSLRNKISADNPKNILSWKNRISRMHPSAEMFKHLLSAYSGGYTHANASYVGSIMTGLNSYDFTSSYPYVMLCYKYPMTQFTPCVSHISSWDFENYAYLITARFYNIESISYNDFISFSKCKEIKGYQLDNGRVFSADTLTIEMTEQDWLTYRDAYSWEKVEIVSCFKSRKGYLPIEITELIAELFEYKQTLKGKPEKAVEYLISKQRLNGIYGMTVTNLVSDEVYWGEENWGINRLDDIGVAKQLDDLFGKELLPYQWGVWVAAYARRNLLSNILDAEEQFGDCVVYCDTDSMKVTADVSSLIDNYNERVKKKVQDYCDRVDRDFSTIAGIGEFDHDATYDEFITLGAKKYAFKETKTDKKTKEKKQVIGITVSGVSKDGVSTLNEDLRNFRDGLLFDEESSGRKVVYYNYEQPDSIEFTDYLGNKNVVVGQRYGICLQPSTYTMGITADFKDFCGSRQCIC